MVSKKFEFPNLRGQTLAAKLELPDGEPRAWALFAHCFTGSKDLLAVSRISRALGALGVAVVRFDFTGLGNSEGDFGNEDFSSNVEDLWAAATHMRDTLRAPDLLIGHSFGGAAQIAAAADIPSAKGVAVLGAPSDTRHLKGLLSKAGHLRLDQRTPVEIAGRTFHISGKFLADLGAHDIEQKARALKIPLLVFHSPDDEIVPFEHGKRLYEWAGGEKSFFSLNGADHLLTDRRDAAFVAEVLAAWASRRVTSRT